MDTRVILVLVMASGSISGSYGKRKVAPQIARVQREDSRQYIEQDEVRPKVVVSQGRRAPIKVVRFKRKPQNLDMPVHLRSCSCCPAPVQIEDVPDMPWYVRFFSCCCCRTK